jgi:hypothetical protein
MTITRQQLSNAFVWEYNSITDDIVYRKFTTDKIPSYLVTVRNASDVFYVRALLNTSTPNYITITDTTSDTEVTPITPILLAPQQSKELLVTFNTNLVNLSTDTVPNINWTIQGLDTVSTSTGEPTVPSTPTLPPSRTPGSGGGSPSGGNLDPMDRDRRGGRTGDEDDFIGPTNEE